MPKIFISYRRDDCEHITGRIHDRLEPHFGRESVFLDIDTIPFGVDFREHLDAAVGQCDILLAIIGDDWIDVRYGAGPKAGQRRLEDEVDFVRIEIEAALARGIPVIPVLVGKAGMPGDEELPEGLRDLAYRNAAEVRSGRDFHDHVDRLIRGIEYLAQQDREARETARQRQDQQKDEKQAGLVPNSYDFTEGKPVAGSAVVRSSIQMSKGDDYSGWKWHHSEWNGLMYGPIPVGIIVFFLGVLGVGIYFAFFNK